MNERRPEQIIPTEPPPERAPGRAPDQTILDDGPPEGMPPPSRPSRPPEHAPSQRTAGGRVQVKRRETPPERAAVVITDRGQGSAPRALDRRTVTRAQAGLCLSSAGTLDVTR